MKKLSYFIAGTLVGATVMTAGGVFADDVKQLLNSKVGSVWELYLDGKEVGEVPIIKGSSYAPVRQIAEIAGFNVEFETGKVYLETKGSGELDTNEPSRVEVIESRLKVLDVIAKSERDTIDAYETLIKQTSASDSETLKFYRDKIAEINVRIADYEAEIASLESELAEIKELESTQSSK